MKQFFATIITTALLLIAMPAAADGPGIPGTFDPPVIAPPAPSYAFDGPYAGPHYWIKTTSLKGHIMGTNDQSEPMTPDQFAKAVADLGKANGMAVTELQFNSEGKDASGTHSYRGLLVGGYGDLRMLMRPAEPHT